MIFDINSKDFIWNYSNITNVLKTFCKYIAWMDDMQTCYINNYIYNNCNKCPYYEYNNHISGLLECVNYEL